jgi:pyruvate/2-oxoglutarate dehydrogenase complex dihydrolipoamide acyltransferase (E2) component
MNKQKGYTKKKLSFNRRAVRASASVTKQKNTIHSISEVDISIPRNRINDYYIKTGTKLSFTAYIVACLANTIKDFPQLNSFIRRRKHILLDDVTISVLTERTINGEKVPEPLAIKAAQNKTYLEIHTEIREAQLNQSEKLGALQNNAWFNLIPAFLLKLFIRLADSNIKMAKAYGKVGVTAVGMFSKEAFWFIPHGSTTVLLTIGSITKKVVEENGGFMTKEHLCLTASLDHDIVDGAPASRFMNDLIQCIKSGDLIQLDSSK